MLSAVILSSPSAKSALLSVSYGIPLNYQAPRYSPRVSASRTNSKKAKAPLDPPLWEPAASSGKDPSGSALGPVSFRRPRGAGRARPGSSRAGPRSSGPSRCSQARLEAGDARGLAPQPSPAHQLGRRRHEARGLGSGVRGGGRGRPASGSRPRPRPRPARRRAPRARPRRRLHAPRPGLSVPGGRSPPAATFPPSQHAGGRRVPGRGAAAWARAARGRRGDSPSSSSRSRWLKIPQKLGRLLMSFLSFISCIR